MQDKYIKYWIESSTNDYDAMAVKTIEDVSNPFISEIIETGIKVA